MAEKEEQKDTEAAEIKEQEGSPELNVFVKLFPKLKDQLELSIEDFSTKLWSKGVIQENVYNKIFDGDYNGSAHRTTYFLKRIHEKIKNEQNPTKARRIITSLVNALRDDAALAHVAQEIADECDNSEDFRDMISDISGSIEGSILPIAAKLFAEKIITDTEYDVITDPSAEHSTAVTNVVLRAVKRAIQSDPNNLYKLREILLSMGPPISILGTKIEEELYNMKH